MVTAFLPEKTNVHRRVVWYRLEKNAGLKAVTLIATLNPVSQVLW
jgi:hypothetical protein